MKPRVLPLNQTQFEEGQWTGKNESGAIPFNDFVIVMPDVHAEKIGSIYLPENEREHQSRAALTGVLVAVGEGAFQWSYDRSRAFTGRKPVPGDRVYFTKYGGEEIQGRDGRLYRQMTDSCIVALIDTAA